MSDHEQFAQVAQKEWGIMSKLLRLLTKNEWMSELLTFWANSSFTHFFGKKRVIRSEILWANTQPCKKLKSKTFWIKKSRKNNRKQFIMPLD